MASDYQRIAQAIEYMSVHASEQPSLEELAGVLGLSPYHVQRLFRRWAGVTPKQFLQQVTVARARQMLQESGTVLDVSLASGLSGPGRLHDHFVTLEAMTPGECRAGGRGLRITCGLADTPFGEALIGRTERGICWLSFGRDDQALMGQWPEAEYRRVEDLGEDLFDRHEAPRVLHVRGTNFQLRVWQALLAIPPGDVTTYGRIARAIGKDPGAARAVGGAVGANPVAFLIPCHRVIRESGALGGYRWGTTRKRALLGWEAATAAGPHTGPA